MLKDHEAPDFILYAQHGWADNAQAIAQLAQAIATPKTRIITPDLGWWRTWLRIEPLIEQVEQTAIEAFSHHPETPVRIIGHSMGGLIWLEVLSRHPEWWPQIESLVLIASPIGGADIARIIDPLGIGIGIARDLGINRREMAQLIAQAIPTLGIAGNIDQGSDGTITVETTKFDYGSSIILPNLPHATLKNHPQVVESIRNFWANPVIIQPTVADFASVLIQRLRSLPGMTDGHWRNFSSSKKYVTLENGLTIRTWKNPLQIEHVFVANREGLCLYSGFVGWLHIAQLRDNLEGIKREYGQS